MMKSEQRLLRVPAALGSSMCSTTGQCPCASHRTLYVVCSQLKLVHCYSLEVASGNRQILLLQNA